MSVVLCHNNNMRIFCHFTRIFCVSSFLSSSPICKKSVSQDSDSKLYYKTLDGILKKNEPGIDQPIQRFQIRNRKKKTRKCPTCTAPTEYIGTFGNSLKMYEILKVQSKNFENRRGEKPILRLPWQSLLASQPAARLAIKFGLTSYSTRAFISLGRSITNDFGKQFIRDELSNLWKNISQIKSYKFIESATSIVKYVFSSILHYLGHTYAYYLYYCLRMLHTHDAEAVQNKTSVICK